jgi:hypothetical protein
LLASTFVIDTRSMAGECVYGNTMCFEMIDGLLVTVHAHQLPDRAEWSAYVDFASRIYHSRGELRIVVFAAGMADGPSSSQRTEFSSKVPPERTKAAIMTDGLAARAAITAFSWFNPNIRGFASHCVNEALAYLEAAPTPALYEAVERMRTHMLAPGRAKRAGR